MLEFCLTINFTKDQLLSQNLTNLMTRARVCIVQVIINGTDKNESEEG